MTSLEPRRLVAIGLALSLLLNVFLLGFVFARLLGPSPSRHEHRTDREAIMERRAKRGPMRAMLREHRGALRGKRKQVRRARRAVRDALVADPFEPERLRTALSDLRQATHDAQEALHGALLETVPKLSPEARAELSRAHRLWSRPGRARRPRR
ncbi:MAG: periplasmic heavy metal sensor [Myxococcales bacterium]|nr:periplasmic heavy metal sensor [Myxococcales bacterium]